MYLESNLQGTESIKIQAELENLFFPLVSFLYLPLLLVTAAVDAS